MELVKHLGTIAPYAVIPDRRTTQNSNVGMTELPHGKYEPADAKKDLEETKSTAKPAAIGVQKIQDYPNIVRDQRLDPRWHEIKYWGKR